jgi:hypothetical protein
MRVDCTGRSDAVRRARARSLEEGSMMMMMHYYQVLVYCTTSWSDAVTVFISTTGQHRISITTV